MHAWGFPNICKHKWGGCFNESSYLIIFRLGHAFADRPKIEQMIFGHPAKDNPFANKLEQQAKAKVDGIEEFTRGFLDDLLRISQTILQGLAIALGQPENFFIEASSDLLVGNIDLNLGNLGNLLACLYLAHL